MPPDCEANSIASHDDSDLFALMSPVLAGLQLKADTCRLISKQMPQPDDRQIDAPHKANNNCQDDCCKRSPFLPNLQGSRGWGIQGSVHHFTPHFVRKGRNSRHEFMHRTVRLLPEMAPGSKMMLAVFLTVVIICAVGGLAYSSGHRAGRVSQLKDQVASYNRRMGLDENSNPLGQVILCQELGGLLDDCQKLGR